jgi:hypothetical protein
MRNSPAEIKHAANSELASRALACLKFVPEATGTLTHAGNQEDCTHEERHRADEAQDAQQAIGCCEGGAAPSEGKDNAH